MVSTRNHPSSFPPPDLSPTKTLVRSPRSIRKGTWTHAPSTITLLWLLVSLPIVCWDTAYVLLRPHSMPNGSLHAPVFTPYALYGKVDYIYGEKAYREHNGFTSAQASLNVAETAGYVAYLWVVWKYGEGEKRAVGGGWGGVACLVAFALSVMTVSKTVLYWSNEYFSGFENIGHNDPLSLLFLWIIPNGLWLLFPSYMIYEFGRDILHGLSIAGGDRSSKPARAVTPTKDE
ncbi:hypothetical protein IMSHALPRED_007605 [Imshaugia aleurites]|uniref:Uncharacterized protein n=1 Tax=Imshaugia aleurites TaxID=172621 RepID=A0A8H3ENB9_9LECA|nr:hypothetical protein IMSHALPRED_007605 [Imshaugia aleurites]